MLTLIWLAVIAAALYLFFRRHYSFFSSHGVKTLPAIPLLGNMGRIVLKMEHFSEHINRCYFTFPEERFVGRFEFIKPTLIVRDIELIKKIAVKDFDYFVDHRTIIDEVSDPLFGRNLFSLKEWKDMRSTLSPAFTSSKIRVMVPFMVEIGDQMNKTLKLKIKESENGYIDVDVKDLTTRYANDVIASCAFGLKVDSLIDVNNQFYAMGKATSTFQFKQLLMFFGFASAPKLMKALRITLFSEESKDFFRNLVMSTMQNREEKNIIRPDMIHLLMEAKKGKLIHDEKTTKDVDAGFATVEESSVGKKNINRRQEWKDMRSTLSPAFTSSKIRVMVPFMVEIGDQMNKTLKLKIKESENGYIDVDVKDLTTRYANDVIASCAFGLKVDSLIDVNNQFYAMGKATSTFQFKQLLMFFGFASAPKLMKALRITLFSEESKDFFRNLVMSTMQNREEKNIIRPDMIHLLMEAKKGKLIHDEKTTKDVDAGFATVEESSVGKKNINRTWSDTDLIAQAILFFIAGFETVSSGMSFLLHELAMNPDVQERLFQEIKENDAKNGGEFDYNSIQQMTYMDMVISEVLRLWPPAIALDRVCVKDYNLGKPNSKATKDFILRKGTGVGIPVWAFHHDPDYFPDPYKFDPERFSEENKHKINPFAYMPFGLGPRNCIGSRFALCEMKVMAYMLLQNLEISPAEKTCIPAELSRDTFNIKLKGGHWVRFRSRN